MPQFQPDVCTFKDDVGMGFWDISHYREHLQFVQVLGGQTPPILLPDYDLSQMLTAGALRRQIVDSHREAHALLDAVLGITELDYSQFDLDSEDDFYSFLGYHSTGHAAIRQALGIS